MGSKHSTASYRTITAADDTAPAVETDQLEGALPLIATAQSACSQHCSQSVSVDPTSGLYSRYNGCPNACAVSLVALVAFLCGGLLVLILPPSDQRVTESVASPATAGVTVTGSTTATVASTGACDAVLDGVAYPPVGVWTRGPLHGTHYELLDGRCPLELFIDLLIGEECGGLPGLNYSDLSPLSFLRDQSALLIGDSVDRYGLRFLCGVPCPTSINCPPSCQYARDVLHAEYSHHTYPMFRGKSVGEGLAGVSVCYFPSLNFTLSQAMTYGILYSSYSGKDFGVPLPQPFSLEQLIHEQLAPFFSPNSSAHVHQPRSNQLAPSVTSNVSMEHSLPATDDAVLDGPQGGFLPSPSIIVAQSGIWDLIRPGVNLKESADRDQFLSTYSTRRMEVWKPAIVAAFSCPALVPSHYSTSPPTSCPLLFMRTLPPTHDFDNQLLAYMSSIVRSEVKQAATVSDNSSSGELEQRHQWHLIDVASMLQDHEDWLWDYHHYGPAVMHQVLNVQLNRWKVKLRQRCPA